MYFNIKDQYRVKHYQIPKVFFTNEKYKALSNDAKIAWGILRDRFTLSAKNEWYDENGSIFFIYTNADLEGILNVGNTKVKKIKKELVQADLLEQKRMGLNKPNRLYLKQPEVTKTDIYEIDHAEENISKEKTPKPLGEKDGRNTTVQKVTLRPSRGSYYDRPEGRNTTASNTDLNDLDFKDTESSNTESIYLSRIEELNNIDIPMKIKQVLKKNMDRLIDNQISLIDIDLFYNSATNNLNDHDFSIVLNNVLSKTKSKIKDITNVLTYSIENYYLYVIRPRETAETTDEETNTYQSSTNGWLRNSSVV